METLSTIKTPERRHWRTCFTPYSRVSIVKFEHVIASWVWRFIDPLMLYNAVARCDFMLKFFLFLFLFLFSYSYSCQTSMMKRFAKIVNGFTH